ncbi:AT-rich interactive domain-containing protein 5B-like [Cydia fagiglandana]|uniref:AT-rich interactive domain-containing protein 5B-like n=1 Tax=Cydia fagiglandana TaxID=1458189 RepID=UPI002FEE10CF
MDKPSFKLVGAPCGQHGQYTFYKALRISGERERIIAIGDFFFVRIWQDSELVSIDKKYPEWLPPLHDQLIIGELQLLWTDRVSDQTLVSLRLYFLPENTPDGRHQHGQVSELLWTDRVSDQTLVSLRLYFLPENTPDGRHQHGQVSELLWTDRVSDQTLVSLRLYFLPENTPDGRHQHGQVSELLWTDRVSDQTLVSLRLYFLPENTPDGRHQHGQDEVLAINDKVVLKAEDLLSWVCGGEEWRWGLRAVWRGDCAPPAHPRRSQPLHHTRLDFSDVEKEKNAISEYTNPPLGRSVLGGEEWRWGLCAVWRGDCAPPAHPRRSQPLHHTRLDFSDVEKEKNAISEDAESPGVVVFSYPRYCRYRALLSRLEGIQGDWLRDSLVCALGGYAAPTKNTRILYCKDTFEYPELEGHEFVCNQLAPKLKGRPRGRRRKRASNHSPSLSDRSSDSDSQKRVEQPAEVSHRHLMTRLRRGVSL